jgi:hypothetical protein
LANNLATLSSKLATALNDTDHEAWLSTEKDDLVTWAVADLYPRFARGLDPESTTITLVAEDYFYSLPSGTVEVSSVDIVDLDGEEAGMVGQGAWSVVGDEWGTQKIRIAPRVVEDHAGGTLRLHGFGRYDTTTNLIPDHLVPLVLAMGRAEAYRRVAGERARFEQWQAASHEQDVTVNELLALTQEAVADVERLRARSKRSVRRPVPARLA